MSHIVCQGENVMKRVTGRQMEMSIWKVPERCLNQDSISTSIMFPAAFHNTVASFK